MDSFRFRQEVVFTAAGRPALGYSSRTWWIDEPRGGREYDSPLATEVGFWRVQTDLDGGSVVEVMLAHPFGIAEVYVGGGQGNPVGVRHNVVVPAATAPEGGRP